MLTLNEETKKIITSDTDNSVGHEYEIILRKEASRKEGVYSLECGYDDGLRNFDHHGIYEGNPSPCNNDRIQPCGGVPIEISHIDADTLIGIMRIMDLFVTYFEKVDMKTVERIDNEGSSGIAKDDPSLQFYVGVGAYAKNINFSRVCSLEQNASEYIFRMLKMDENDYINLGKSIIDLTEKNYPICLREMDVDRKIGFWVMDRDHYFDPSRAYEEVDIVVVFRGNYKTISIYCNPTSDYNFAGKIFAGIEFNGHPKACGSPRGEEMGYSDALLVYLSVKSIL